MSHNVIDRRPNSGGASTGNRERFMRKAKESIKKAIRETVTERSVTNTGQQKVRIPIDGITEPTFRHDQDTIDDKYVTPGNDGFVVGDLLRKPAKKSGKGNEASDSGDGEDEFEFVLSKEEYSEILFDGLDLPDFIKKSSKQVVSTVRVRAGYSASGNPATLDLEQSMVNSFGRRIALKFPKLRKIRELEELLLLEMTDDERQALVDEIARLKRKANAISFLDPLDLKYKRFDHKTQPMSQAVMFCIMDVSGSVDEYMKDMAKRFFLLLSLFLSIKYQNIDIVFIRHTTSAKECTEEEFFHSRESGGTIVSSAFKLATEIIKERYPTDEWNIYLAAASDGDNWESDNPELTRLVEAMLPTLQYFMYLELAAEPGSVYISSGSRATNLWMTYDKISERHENMILKELSTPAGIYSVFKEIFDKDN